MDQNYIFKLVYDCACCFFTRIHNKDIYTILAFLIISNSLSAQVHYFEAENPGIFSFSKSHFQKIEKDILYYTNGESYCKPYYSDVDNKYYVYASKKGIYQIGANLNKGRKLDIDSIRVIKNIDHVFLEAKKLYSVTDHSVHKYIPRSTRYKEELVLKEKPLNRKSALFIDLYNPTRKTSHITLKIEDTTIDTTLSPYGKKRISLSTNTPKDKRLNLSLLSIRNPVCIMQYGISNVNTVFFLENDFSTHVFTKSSNFNEEYFNQMSKLKGIKVHDEYQFFHIEDGELKVLRQKGESQSFTNLICSKKAIIVEPGLKKVEDIEKQNFDFLVIYDSQFENYIEDVNNLILSINKNANIFSVDAQKIYNTYSFGQPSEESIKKYLKETSPQNLLLIGSPENVHDNNSGYIPTFVNQQFETGSLYVSDYPYAYLSNPYDPIISVGRLPFRSGNYLKKYLEKIYNYIKKVDHSNSIMLIDEEILPKNVKRKLLEADNHYSDIDISHVIFEKWTTNNIIRDINESPGDVLFHTGHGSITGWGNKGQIDDSDFEKISEEKYFKLFDMSCWTGLFSNSDKECFSEELLKKKSGAISIVASSKRTPVRTYLPFFKEFTKNGNGKTIGSLLNEVKKSLLEQDQVDMHDIHSFNLLGIPSLPY